jgi:hypothetical protein
MKQSEHFLENAENCAQRAERTNDKPAHNRYKRMEAPWRALAEGQDWLDGEVSPERDRRVQTVGQSFSPECSN